jgi:hypothetical protein
MLSITVHNAWPHGEESFHVVPFFGIYTVIAIVVAIGLIAGLFMWLKSRKK